MDRSDFLKTLGFGGAAIMTAPSFLAGNKEETKEEITYKEKDLKLNDVIYGLALENNPNPHQYRVWTVRDKITFMDLETGRLVHEDDFKYYYKIFSPVITN